jgi:hypothetical protein
MNPRKPVGKALRACVSAQPLSLCGAGAPRRQARAEHVPHTSASCEVLA